MALVEEFVRLTARHADAGTLRGLERRFAERLLSFFYYLNVADYPEALGRLDRNRASGTPMPADYPERLPTYVEMRPGKVKPG